MVIGVTRLFQFDCNGRHSAYQIKFKSIPGINKYWAMKVTFLAQGKQGKLSGFLLTYDRHVTPNNKTVSWSLDNYFVSWAYQLHVLYFNTWFTVCFPRTPTVSMKTVSMKKIRWCFYVCFLSVYRYTNLRTMPYHLILLTVSTFTNRWDLHVHASTVNYHYTYVQVIMSNDL